MVIHSMISVSQDRLMLPRVIAGAPLSAGHPGQLCLVFKVLLCCAGCSNPVLELNDAEQATPVVKITNDEQATFGTSGDYVGALAVSPDGKRLASGSTEVGFPKRCVRLWDLPAPNEAVPVVSSEDTPRHLEFSRDGQVLVFAGVGTFGLVDVETRKVAVRWKCRGALQSTCACLSPDGRTVVAAETFSGESSVLGVWDIAAQKRIENQKPEFNSWGFDLRLVSWGDAAHVPTSGKNLVIVGTDDQAQLHVRVFDASGKCVLDADETTLPRQQLQIPQLKRKLPELYPPHVLLDDEKAWVILMATPIELRPRPEAELGQRRAQEPQPLSTLDGHRGLIVKFAFSPDGKTLASASYDGTVKLWDFAARREIATLTVEGLRLLSTVVFSPDGNTIATAGKPLDSPLRLWDVATGRLKTTLKRQRGNIVAVVFTPNGKGLVSASGATAVLWDVPAERPLAEFVTGGRIPSMIHSMVITPDGKTLLAGCGDGTIKRWQMPADRQWK
jgi:WD40 repeat protein